MNSVSGPHQNPKVFLPPPAQPAVKRPFCDTVDSTVFWKRFAKRVQNKCFSELLFIEIFSGTAGLTAHIRRSGFGGIGIDSVVKASSKAPILKLNLLTDDGQALLFDMLSQENVFGVHLGPPCGTSSRAREINKHKPGMPQPLRNEAFPDGFTYLRGKDKARVRSANTLYDLTARVARFCSDNGILFSVENPASSLFWNTSFWRHGTKGIPDLVYTQLHHCMFGSQRKKRTIFCHNWRGLCKIGVMCDDKHYHLGWGRTGSGWATAQEVAYPNQLCKAYSDALSQVVCEFGGTMPPMSVQDLDGGVYNSRHAQVGSDKQPRGKRIPPLVPEHKLVVVARGPASCVPTSQFCKTGGNLPSTCQCISHPPLTNIPAGSKLLRTQQLGGVGGCSSSTSEVAIGIPWTVQEFLDKASGLGHPRLFLNGIPDELEQTIRYNVSANEYEAGRFRTETLRKWMTRAVELREAERELKQGMSEHRSRILGDKKLLLFQEMLDSTGYPDGSLAADMGKGFDLVGRLPPSKAFPRRSSFATLTGGQVRSIASRTRQAIWHSTKPSSSQLIDQEVYKVTMEEKEAGWLQGPMQLHELKANESLTRRFGIQQSGTDESGNPTVKVRPIDNFTESLINLTNSSCESIPVHTVDVVAASLIYRLTLGNVAGVTEDLLIKAIDLKKAYKQLALSDDALTDSCLCVRNPTTGKPEAFRALVLPFGARAAVQGFYRCSHGLWWLGVNILRLHWTLFFDDFALIGRRSEARHLELVSSAFFALLGWSVSEDKGLAFDTFAKALGVIIDLGESSNYMVTIKNTEKRGAEISKSIREILDSGRYKAGQLATLRGRILFAEGQLFGRSSAFAVQTISRFVDQHHGGRVDPDLREALLFLEGRLMRAVPRTLKGHLRDLLHIYTDASFSDDLAAIGGVLVDEAGIPVSYFSHRLCTKEIDRINISNSETVIGELEALAMLVGLKIFGKGSEDSEIIIFGDNEGAVRSFISMRSENLFVSAALKCYALLEESSYPFVWFERVPSASNVADKPSRLELAGFEHLSKHEVDLREYVDDVLSHVQYIQSKAGGSCRDWMRFPR